MLQGLKLFTETSDLQANQGKSTIYCTSMNDDEIKRIKQFSRFPREHLPFRYLGVPISSKKITAADCDALVEEMSLRIRS